MHPALFPVFRQGVLDARDGCVIEDKGFTFPQPVAGSPDHSAFPAGSELAQRDTLRRKLGIQNRVEQMQRAKNELAGIHRQFAFLRLPVVFAESQIAQTKVKVSDRPVRSL
ncbi:hypothetical protein SDC9_162807 [bioreactor metagenome]|uniref:Uncharacterized protein n=1 Tax=bioreactor metagenome TaxID=1076179 RepID=A0A645FTR0_9ZZZZ